MKLELYYPVKPKSVNQGFGLNPKYYAKFGLNGHNGIDFMAEHGHPVYAAHDGLAFYEVDSNQGAGIVLRTARPYDFKGIDDAYYKTVYWHLCYKDDPKYPIQIPLINQGYPVKAGQLLGYADNTGAPYESTGDHLHFGLKPQAEGEDPGIWYNLAQKNGFLGAIDPTPFFNGSFAEDIQKITDITQTAISVSEAVLLSPEIEISQKLSILQKIWKAILGFLVIK